LDQLEDVNFPQNGYFCQIHYLRHNEAFGGSTPYEKLEMNGFAALSKGENTWALIVSGHSGLGTDVPFYDYTSLGGLFNLSGYHFDAFQGSHGGMVGLLWLRRWSPWSSRLVGPLYLGGSLEYGNTWTSSSAVSWEEGLLNSSLFIGLETMLGPLYLAYGESESNRNAWHLYLGRFF
jgi:NTE family protein